jgi:hypothetical protein
MNTPTTATLKNLIESESSKEDADYACKVLRTGTAKEFLSVLSEFLNPLVIERVVIVLQLETNIRSGEGQLGEQEVAHLVHQTALRLGATEREEKIAWNWVYP